jgi:hypothetical protein
LELKLLKETKLIFYWVRAPETAISSHRHCQTAGGDYSVDLASIQREVNTGDLFSIIVLFESPKVQKVVREWVEHMLLL